MCTIMLHSMVQGFLSTVCSGMLWPEGCIEEALWGQRKVAVSTDGLFQVEESDRGTLVRWFLQTLQAYSVWTPCSQERTSHDNRTCGMTGHFVL